MKNTEDRNNLKQRFAPYSKMDADQLLEAFCGNSELQKEFGSNRLETTLSAFLDFIRFIKQNYENSPIQQEEEWRSLIETSYDEIKEEIRRIRRETKKSPASGGEKTDLAKVPISELIKQGESHSLEFKETLEYNIEKKEKNKDILHSSLKTIAGFLNAKGGTLLIGVDNLGKIRGIKRDLSIMKHGNNDRFEQKIRNCLKDRFKPQPIGKVNISFEKFTEGMICRVDVQTSREIVHLDNEVYVRDGNTTQKLEGQSLTDWIQQRSN